MPRKLKGIRRKRRGWQAYTEIRGKTHSKAFPLSTPVQEMREWIEDEREKYDTASTTTGSFGADIVTYLGRVSAMPTHTQRAAHLALWAHELGRDRPRRSITTEEIDVVLQGWLETCAPATVRKRRTALQSFFMKMDGKKSTRANPVKGADNPRVPALEARAIDYLLIERAIAAMPDYCSVKPGTVKPLSLSKIRTRVLAYTGLPPGLLQTITASDLQLQAGTVRVRPRRKGKGVEARTLPLTVEGLDAFKAFHAANAYGPFAVGALNVSFKRGCQRAGLDPSRVHLYDLRHSFLTELYRVTRDLATVGRLGLHCEGSPMTARYAKGANDAVDAAAVQGFSVTRAAARQQALKAAPIRKRLPATPARRRKASRRRHLRKVG